MTTYWDEKEELASGGDVKEFENQAIEDVKLIIADREFPEDLRIEILSVIDRLNIGTEQGKQWFKAMVSSRLLRTLHTIFHEVARRRIKTRFGMLSDSPSQCLMLMDDHRET